MKPFRLGFGKFKGEAITRVPASYLNWMITNGHPFAFKAEEELARRGMPCNNKIDIAPHSIDRASQRMMHLWISTQQTDEGLYAWLQRRATEALEATALSEREGRKLVEYDGIVFVMEFTTAVPILVSVWLAGGKAEP